MVDNIDLSASGPVEPTMRRYRRLVSGFNKEGRSVFIEDRDCPNVHPILGLPDFAFTEFWQTSGSPVVLAEEADDPAAVAPCVPPPKSGTAFRVVQFPPDSRWQGQLGGSMMHQTSSIDYVYVLEGEIYAVLETEERLMSTGDVLIQRGTKHDWSNRSDKPCSLLVVLIDAVLPSGT